MKSAQVAAQAGVNVQTLRYYERRGLLPEPERTESGYRAWSPDAVRVVRFVKRAQRLGFSLAEIESLLGLAAGGPESCDAARQLAVVKIAELDERLASLSAMRNSLLELVESCARPRARRDCPLLGPACWRIVATRRCGAVRPDWRCARDWCRATPIRRRDGLRRSESVADRHRDRWNPKRLAGSLPVPPRCSHSLLAQITCHVSARQRRLMAKMTIRENRPNRNS